MQKKSKSFISPLRYPGSKAKIFKKLLPYINIRHKEYREPFLGGASIFLTKPQAETSWLNDKDENIATLWNVIKNRPDELCNIIDMVHPTIDLWKIISNENYITDEITRAFRCLFLNRTNYSGILNAKPIGGFSQSSKYKIDCRWNQNILKQRIMHCSSLLRNTKITSLNFDEIIEENGTDVFIVIDPPYYQKGSMLYPISMTPHEHKHLSDLLRYTTHKFLLTIDDCDTVRKLYSWANFTYTEQWFYTINSQQGNCKMGKELFITNFDIKLQAPFQEKQISNLA